MMWIFQRRITRCAALAAVSILSAPFVQAEPLSGCGAAPFNFDVGAEVLIDKFDEVLISDGGLNVLSIPLRKGETSSHKISLNELNKVKSWPKSENLQVVYRDADTPANNCAVKAILSASNAPAEGDNGKSSSSEVDLSACQEEASKYYSQIKKNHKDGKVSGGFSLVVFCGATIVFQESRERRDGGISGEPIYVGLYDTTGIKDFRFEFLNCSAEPAGPRGYISGSFKGVSDLLGPQASRPSRAYIVPAIDKGQQGVFRRCYNESVDMVLKGVPSSGAKGELARYTLRQAQTYHFTTQIGIVSTDNVSHKYVLSDDGSGNKKIRDSGPIGDGPRYFASVVLYGFPYQVKSLFTGESYRGRALQYDNGLFDRLGFLLGVGLSNPKDEFVSGLTLELMTGVNLVWAHRWAKVEVLDGVSVGDTYRATTELPTQEKWKSDWSFGVSLDLRYVTSLLERK